MKKLWYCLFYALCVFTLAFSFAWMLPRRSGLPPLPRSTHEMNNWKKRAFTTPDPGT